MLSRKQQWRRTKERRKNSLGKEVCRTEWTHRVESSDQEIPQKVVNPDNIAPSSPNGKRLKSALSSSNLLDLEERRLRNQRSLRFSSTVRVLLIPSRYEVTSRSNNIYWLSEDYSYFKREAVKEIKEAAKANCLAAKAAMNLLYQPDSEDSGPLQKNLPSTSTEQSLHQPLEQSSYDHYVSYDDGFEGDEGGWVYDPCQSDGYFHHHCDPTFTAKTLSDYNIFDECSPHSITMASSTAARQIRLIDDARSGVGAEESPQVSF